MNAYALFMWMIVAASPVSIEHPKTWVYMTDFTTSEKCKAAGRELLQAAPSRAGEDMLYRCIPK